MSWRLDSIEELLIDDPNCPIEDLLIEENITLEVSSEEREIIVNYFCRGETILSLMDLALNDKNDKYRALAVETMNASGFEITNAMFEVRVFDQLILILVSEGVESARLKVAADLFLGTLKKDSTKTLMVLKRHPEFTKNIFVNIAHPSVTDLLYYLFISLNVEIQKWVIDGGLLNNVMDYFNPENPSDVYSYLTETVVSVITFNSENLAKEEFYSHHFCQLFDYLKSAKKKYLFEAFLQIINSVFETGFKKMSLNRKRSIINLYFQSMSSLIEILTKEGETIHTSHGDIESVGIKRFGVLRLMSSFIRNNMNLEDEIIESGALKSIVDFFFRFPDNTFVHTTITQLISEIVDNGGDKLIDHLIQVCRLDALVMESLKLPTEHHMPYNGHLMLIIESMMSRENFISDEWENFITDKFMPIKTVYTKPKLPVEPSTRKIKRKSGAHKNQMLDPFSI